MVSAHRIGRVAGGGRYPKVRCRECRGEFYLPCEKDSYPFRVRKKYFCSWKCLRAYEKTHKEKESIHLDYLM